MVDMSGTDGKIHPIKLVPYVYKAGNLSFLPSLPPSLPPSSPPRAYRPSDCCWSCLRSDPALRSTSPCFLQGGGREGGREEEVSL